MANYIVGVYNGSNIDDYYFCASSTEEAYSLAEYWGGGENNHRPSGGCLGVLMLPDRLRYRPYTGKMKAWKGGDDMSKLSRKKSWKLNKRKFVRFTTGFLALFIVIALAVSVFGGNKVKIVDSTVHVIHEGDTVWGIALEAGNGLMDTRTVVHDIIRLNNWDTVPVIRPGDKILVPVYQAED